MARLNKNKIGLALGTFIALMHAVWSLIVAVIPAQLQKFLDWVFVLHHIKPMYVLLPFNIANAALLVVLTFVVGYVFGYVFAAVWDWANK